MSIDANDDRTASSSVYLELSEGSSHKFYQVTVNGVEVTIRYGRIGTPGQSSSKTYATPEQAQAEATKKIHEKQRKGYVQIPSGEIAATPVDRPTEKLSTVETENSVSRCGCRSESGCYPVWLPQERFACVCISGDRQLFHCCAQWIHSGCDRCYSIVWAISP